MEKTLRLPYLCVSGMVFSLFGAAPSALPANGVSQKPSESLRTASPANDAPNSLKGPPAAAHEPENRTSYPASVKDIRWSTTLAELSTMFQLDQSRIYQKLKIPEESFPTSMTLGAVRKRLAENGRTLSLCDVRAIITQLQKEQSRPSH